MRPSPRDCVTASLHDSAPGQLVTSAMRACIRQPDSGRRQPPIELRHESASPSGTPDSARRSRESCRRQTRRQVAQHAHLLAGEIAQRNRRRHEEIPALLLLARRSCAASANSRRSSSAASAGPAARCPGPSPANWSRATRSPRQIGGERSAPRPAPASTGGCSGSNGSVAPPSARNSSSASRCTRAEAVPAERLDRGTSAGSLLVLVVAEPVEHADDRFRARRTSRRPAGSRAAGSGDASPIAVPPPTVTRNPAPAVERCARSSRCR